MNEWDGGRKYFIETAEQTNKGGTIMTALVAAGLVVKVPPLKTRSPVGGHEFTIGTVRYYPTFEGYEYLERHQHRLKMWFKNNWFALIVAAVSSAIGISNIIVVAVSRGP